MQAFKKYVINQLAKYDYENSEDKLVLVTSGGVLYGRPFLEDELENENNNLAKEVVTYFDEYAEENSISTPLKGNDGALVLKDATFWNGRLHFELGETAVFFDQILAVSFGDISRFNNR